MKEADVKTPFINALKSAKNKEQLTIIWDSLSAQMKGLSSHDYVVLARVKKEISKYVPG